MKYKIITLISKRLYKKKAFENVSKKTMFPFSEYMKNMSLDDFNDILEGEFVNGDFLLKNEANALRLEDALINEYAHCADIIIDNRINGARLNIDKFYNAPAPLDEGASLTGHKNEEQRKRLIILSTTFAIMSFVMMLIVIFIYSKLNAFY